MTNYTPRIAGKCRVAEDESLGMYTTSLILKSIFYVLQSHNYYEIYSREKCLGVELL